MKSTLRALPVLPILAALAFLVFCVPAHAQSRRFEIANHFTFLNVGERAPGFGGTFSYNVTRRFGLESTLNFFPGDPRSNLGSRIRPVLGGWNLGNILQGQFGAKGVVLRSRKAEFFLKAKPGFVSFSDERYSGTAGLGPFLATGGRQTSFALDIGGGVELYPTRSTFLRLDLGDTYFRYNSFTTVMRISGLGGAFIMPNAGFRGSSVHTLQLSTGVGLRFGRSN
jgi:hypothetical protein